MRRKEAEQNNENSVHAQWRDQVERAVNVIVNRAIKAQTIPGTRFERSLVGDLKRRVQQQRAELFGQYKQSSVEELQVQYRWLVSVEKSIMETKELPIWLR